MNTIPRSAGIGSWSTPSAPPPGSSARGAREGTSSRRWLPAMSTQPLRRSFAFWYLGALAALGLLAFGHGLRRLGGAVGDAAWALSIAAVAISVVGAFVGGGLTVALAEGGAAVQQARPPPVVYTISEIGNLLSLCGPALFIGVSSDSCWPFARGCPAGSVSSRSWRGCAGSSCPSTSSSRSTCCGRHLRCLAGREGDRPPGRCPRPPRGLARLSHGSPRAPGGRATSATHPALARVQPPARRWRSHPEPTHHGCGPEGTDKLWCLP